MYGRHDVLLQGNVSDLPLISTNQLRFAEDVTFDCIQQLLFRAPGWKTRLMTQCIELEKVPVCRTARRAWSAVADLRKIVLALFSTVAKRFFVADSCWEFVNVRR